MNVMRIEKGAAIVLFSAVWSIGCGCTYIDPGSVGVKISRSGGGVDSEPLGPGYHAYWPIATTVEEYPVSMQTVVYTKDLREGSAENEEVSVNSVEGQPITCDVSLSFELEPKKVPELYTRFRQPIDVITHTFVRNAIRGTMQDVIGQKHVADVLGKDKAVVVREVTEKLQHQLGAYGFKIQQFTLNAVRAPKSIEDAIASKNAMEQDALRSSNEKKKKEYEAEQLLIAAKAEAGAILLRAHAQAQANELITRSLTPTLVNYKAIERWNGQLPQFGGGAVPFVNIAPPGK